MLGCWACSCAPTLPGTAGLATPSGCQFTSSERHISEYKCVSWVQIFLGPWCSFALVERLEARYGRHLSMQEAKAGESYQHRNYSQFWVPKKDPLSSKEKLNENTVLLDFWKPKHWSGVAKNTSKSVKVCILPLPWANSLATLRLHFLIYKMCKGCRNYSGGNVLTLPAWGPEFDQPTWKTQLWQCMLVVLAVGEAESSGWLGSLAR